MPLGADGAPSFRTGQANTATGAINSTDPQTTTDHYTGQIYVPVAGTLTFATAEDDGALVGVDGDIFANSGAIDVNIPVLAGWHNIDLMVTNNGTAGKRVLPRQQRQAHWVSRTTAPTGLALLRLEIQAPLPPLE